MHVHAHIIPYIVYIPEYLNFIFIYSLISEYIFRVCYVCGESYQLPAI